MFKPQFIPGEPERAHTLWKKTALILMHCLATCQDGVTSFFPPGVVLKTISLWCVGRLGLRLGFNFPPLKLTAHFFLKICFLKFKNTPAVHEVNQHVSEKQARPSNEGRSWSCDGCFRGGRVTAAFTCESLAHAQTADLRNTLPTPEQPSCCFFLSSCLFTLLQDVHLSVGQPQHKPFFFF